MNKEYPSIDLDKMTLSSTCINETLTMTAPMEDLNEVLEVIERFLKASGYLFDGRLALVDFDAEVGDMVGPSMADLGSWGHSAAGEDEAAKQSAQSLEARRLLDKLSIRKNK